MGVWGMPMHVPIPMFMPVVHVGFTMCVRVFVEHQGLDGHWNGVGGHSDAAQINEIKAPKGHAIDDQDVALNARVFLENMSQIVRNVAIRHNEQGSLLSKRLRNGADDAVGQLRQTCIGRCTQPSERNGHILRPFLQVMPGKGLLQIFGNDQRVDVFAKHRGQGDHLQVFSR